MNYEFTYSSQSTSSRARGYIFVVSHMRSFSTLLCHILGSHKEIAGYAEAHQAYTGRTDLLRLVRKVESTIEGTVSGRYVLDKVLHGSHPIAHSVLARRDVRVLLMVRNPDDTIRSILHMRRVRGIPAEPANAVRYYQNRLAQIDAYGQQLGRDALYLDSESLLGQTDAVLDGLSRWLGLGERLSATYRTFKFSGNRGFGDPLPHILAGRVIADDAHRHREYLPVAIPDALLQSAREFYRACRETLLARHPTVTPEGPTPAR